MRIGRVSRVRINRLPTNSVIRRSPSSGGVPLFLAMYQGWLIRPVNRIGHVKTWGILVYIRMYRAYVHV